MAVETYREHQLEEALAAATLRERQLRAELRQIELNLAGLASEKRWVGHDDHCVVKSYDRARAALTQGPQE